MPEPAKKAFTGLMPMVVLTVTAMLAVMAMLTVMVMLGASLMLTTWPGRRKCHDLRMPANRPCSIVAGSQAAMQLTITLQTLPRALPPYESPRQRDRH
jgi:hypothetical protein